MLILFLFSLFLLRGYCQYNHQALLSSVLFTWFAWCYYAYYGFHCSSRKSGCIFFPQCKYSSVNSHLWVRKNLGEYWAVYFSLTRMLNWSHNSMSWIQITLVICSRAPHMPLQKICEECKNYCWSRESYSRITKIVTTIFLCLKMF